MRVRLQTRMHLGWPAYLVIGIFAFAYYYNKTRECIYLFNLWNPAKKS